MAEVAGAWEKAGVVALRRRCQSLALRHYENLSKSEGRCSRPKNDRGTTGERQDRSGWAGQGDIAFSLQGLLPVPIWH